jgi:hypothetical protein
MTFRARPASFSRKELLAAHRMWVESSGHQRGAANQPACRSRCRPGGPRLVMRSSLTGSSATPKTIGIVVVAALAANAAGVPPVAAITATFRLTAAANSRPMTDQYAKREPRPRVFSWRSLSPGRGPGNPMGYSAGSLNEGSAWKTRECARRFLTERPAQTAHRAYVPVSRMTATSLARFADLIEPRQVERRRAAGPRRARLSLRPQ